MTQFAMILVGAVLVLGLLAFLLLGSGGNSTTKRLNGFRARYSDSAAAQVEQQMRKAIASRRPINFNIGDKLSFSDRVRLRLQQTGKNWTIKQYTNVSAGLFGLVFLFFFIKGAPLMLAIGFGAAAGAWVPHLAVKMAINKRLKNFTTRFPDAIELLVRGLKSGLPVSETLNVVAKEIPGPVGEEFRIVTEKIKIGKTMEESLQETADRLGTPEFQFFVITLAIQRETGGNLAETLSNLSDVLRKRAQMKLKIRAMSSESKASAYIVGSLPFFVFAMVWYVNPEYLAGFFYEPRLIIAGVGGAVWMSIGAFIMAKMVSFEI
jgi:tight adherence protein B